VWEKLRIMSFWSNFRKTNAEKSIHSEKFDKYMYVINNTAILKLVYAIGIFTWFLSLYGHVLFLNLNIYYWIIFGPFIFILSCYYLIIYLINLFYKTPDLNYHKSLVQFFTSNKSYAPSVDIFLPVCGESRQIINRTWLSVSNIDYPNYKVFVLDDKGDLELENLAKEYGFEYLSRPNKGEMKKAGNLKYGFERTSGEYIVVFDADFSPLSEFLNETVPYMILDKKVGILQTPQYFEIHKNLHKKSWLEYGAAATQEDFYRIIQVARNSFGGAICVGTNAVYRRSSLETFGGTYQIEHSEDVWTGVMMLQNKFKIKYIPYILAQGYCPDDFISFFKQQYRWCKGSMSLLFSSTFWKLKIPFQTRLSYISGFLYYIHAAFPSFLSVIGFVALANHFENITIWYTVPFLPFLFFSFFILPFTRLHNIKIGVFIASFAALSAYTLALFHTIFKINMSWQPTGQKNVNNYWFNFVYVLNAVFISAYALVVGIFFLQGKILINDFQYYGIIFWIVYNISMYSLYLFVAGKDAYGRNFKLEFPKSVAKLATSFRQLF
jgi:cellulose synthase (UDP-forming)